MTTDNIPATGLVLTMPMSFPGAAKHLAHRLSQLVAKCRPGYCVSKGVRDQIEECQAVALATVSAIESSPQAVAADAADMLRRIVAAYEAMHAARMEHETEDPVPGAEQRETHQRLVLAILMDKARKLLAA